MCGIFCLICQVDKNNKDDCKFKFNDWLLCKENVDRRGPDIQSEHSVVIDEKWQGIFAASVLWMQGDDPVVQPCLDNQGNILLWNGDIFSGPLAVDHHESDTLTLLKELKSSNNIIETLKSIEGPFSIIYYQKSSNKIYFARDILGRHSLLINIDRKNNSLTLSSVSCKKVDNIIELPAIGIFSIDLTNLELNLALNPWEKINDRSLEIIDKLQDKFLINVILEQPIFSSNFSVEHLPGPQPGNSTFLDTFPTSKNFQETMELLLQDSKIDERVNQLLELLKNSVKIRVSKKPDYCKDCLKIKIKGENIKCNHAKVGVLFSGGLDSTILAAIADEFIPENETIDLINVAFEKVAKPSNNKNNKNTAPDVPTKFNVPDRKTGREALSELQKIFPNRAWNFIEVFY